MALKPLLWAITLLFVGYVQGAKDIFGLRKNIYNPRCAHACRSALRTSSLECTSRGSTLPNCYASNDPFLQTLAFCISAQCKDVSMEDIDKYWSRYVAGWDNPTPAPAYNYWEAVDLARNPEQTISYGKPLDKASRVTQKNYNLAYASLADWDETEKYHTKFALVIFLAGFVAPISLSLLRFIPLQTRLASKYRSYFIYPLIWRNRWNAYAQERYNIGDISPTCGQALFITWMLVLNGTLSSIRHVALAQQLRSFDGRHGQFITCLSNRFGALALANLPLLILYSGRNDILLRITNWSHTTFIMLHRWLAYITIIEALLHSILYLQVARVQGKHSEWASMQAWYCGSIATISIALILPLSLLAIRRRAYEAFLISHIAFSFLILIGIYIHVSDLFDTKWASYVLYTWFAVLIWVVDRVARLVRLALNGITEATVTIIDDEYIRVDVPNAKGHGHAYLYFPTLTWRFWENHPFSIATVPRPDTPVNLVFDKLPPSPPSSYIRSPTFSLYSKSSSSSSSGNKSNKYTPTIELKVGLSFDAESVYDATSPISLFTPISPNSALFQFLLSPTGTPSDKGLLSPTSTKSSFFPSHNFPLSPTSTTNLILPPFTTDKPLPPRPQGLTFFMRTHKGTTDALRRRTSLLVLVESSYGPPKNTSRYPLLICVAGGVGITAVLPYLHAHPGQAKLYWGSRSQALVNAMREEVRGYSGEVIVGKRLFIKLALQREFAMVPEGVDVAIVVSGPKGMAEDVREFVCEVAKKRNGDVILFDENFGW